MPFWTRARAAGGRPGSPDTTLTPHWPASADWRHTALQEALRSCELTPQWAGTPGKPAHLPARQAHPGPPGQGYGKLSRGCGKVGARAEEHGAAGNRLPRAQPVRPRTLLRAVAQCQLRCLCLGPEPRQALPPPPRGPALPASLWGCTASGCQAGPVVLGIPNATLLRPSKGFALGRWFRLVPLWTSPLHRGEHAFWHIIVQIGKKAF